MDLLHHRSPEVTEARRDVRRGQKHYLRREALARLLSVEQYVERVAEEASREEETR
jgi:hypothetical protein